MATEWTRCSKHSKALHLRADDTVNFLCCCGKCTKIKVLKLDRRKAVTSYTCPNGLEHRIHLLDAENGALKMEKPLLKVS
jgi:lysyl-tRNA synthetase class I